MDLGYNLINSRFLSSFNALRFLDLGGFVSNFTGASFSINSRGRNHRGSGTRLFQVVAGLSISRALIQPFAFVNQSLGNLRMHLLVFGFWRS